MKNSDRDVCGAYAASVVASLASGAVVVRRALLNIWGVDHQDAIATRSADAELLTRLRAGEEAAFAELVQQHAGRLLAVIRRLLQQEEDAQDALQETFLSAFRALAGFEGNAQLATWLHRIAVNAALAKLRSKQRKPERSIEDLLPKYFEDGHRQQPGPPWTTTAADLLQSAEVRDLVRRSIQQLPESHRAILVLRDIEQMDTVEVAKCLGIEPGTVKTRLHRARQALRTLLDPHFRGDGP